MSALPMPQVAERWRRPLPLEEHGFQTLRARAAQCGLELFRHVDDATGAEVFALAAKSAVQRLETAEAVLAWLAATLRA